jgi:cytochrome c biogenesis protein CcmG/thiol:disulfide interchange protein DsbE
MDVGSTTRSAVTGTGRLIRQNKVISAVTAAFAVAIIVVSLTTTGTGAPRSGQKAASDPAAHGFTLAALGKPGQQVSLSQYQGKPLVINFWASWCPPCQQETPLLARWYKQQDGHVVLLGLDENDAAATALKFAQAKGVTYPIGFDPNVTVALSYGVDGLPQTFFLNASHHIVDHVPGALTAADLAKGLRLMNGA